MEQLEIGEHVDLDTGLTIERTMEDEYAIWDLENEQQIPLYPEEIQKLAQLAGLMGVPVDQEDW